MSRFCDFQAEARKRVELRKTGSTPNCQNSKIRQYLLQWQFHRGIRKATEVCIGQPQGWSPRTPLQRCNNGIITTKIILIPKQSLLRDKYLLTSSPSILYIQSCCGVESRCGIQHSPVVVEFCCKLYLLSLILAARDPLAASFSMNTLAWISVNAYNGHYVMPLT